MRRRDFIKVIAGSATVWPLAARAQQATTPVVGYVNGGSQQEQGDSIAGIERGLAETGYVSGKNIAIEYRFANFQYDHLPELVGDLVRRQVSVIAAVTPVAALAAKKATTSIPIVFALGSDPVKDGLVASLNRPGGNLTGATFFSNLLAAKRIELLHQIAPDAKVIAHLLNPNNANVDLETKESQGAARALGLELILLEATNELEIDRSLAESQRKARWRAAREWRHTLQFSPRANHRPGETLWAGDMLGVPLAGRNRRADELWRRRCRCLPSGG